MSTAVLYHSGPMIQIVNSEEVERNAWLHYQLMKEGTDSNSDIKKTVLTFLSLKDDQNLLFKD